MEEERYVGRRDLIGLRHAKSIPQYMSGTSIGHSTSSPHEVATSSACSASPHSTDQ